MEIITNHESVGKKISDTKNINFDSFYPVINDNEVIVGVYSAEYGTPEGYVLDERKQAFVSLDAMKATLLSELRKLLEVPLHAYAAELLADIPDDRDTKADILQAALDALEDGEYLCKLLGSEDNSEEQNAEDSKIVDQLFGAFKALLKK